MSYIHPSARDSYRHWWEQQTHWLFWSYGARERFVSVSEEIGYLYPHFRAERKRRRRYRWVRQHYRLRAWDISTSGESSFRQNGYEPSIATDHDISRQDWRERKGIKRDKAKRYQGKGRHYNAHRYGKDMVHGARRAKERECIAKGRYDEITQAVQDDCRMWWD